MFTGIVEEIGRVKHIQPGKLTVSASRVLEDMRIGDSININGACLTVTQFDSVTFSVDIMQETMRRSNLSQLKAGDGVNLERALAFGDRLGGHIVQGHVDAVGHVLSVRREGDSLLLEVEAPRGVMRYVVEKGFIAVEGLSLTVVHKWPTSFTVSIVEYTRTHTTISERGIGDPVNLEADVIAKYIETLTGSGNSSITEEFLREHGFLVS